MEVHGPPPFPCAVNYTEQQGAVQGSLRRAILRRALDSPLLLPTTPTQTRERGALEMAAIRGAIQRKPRFAQRSARRSSLFPDCPRKTRSSDGTYYLFRGRPVPNSIFADGDELFPQMDVWSRCCVGRTKMDRFGKIDGPLSAPR